MIEDGDQHVAFKTLKLLRPWQPARRAQLKRSTGHLPSPADELKTLQQYAESICAAHDPLPPMIGRLPTLEAAVLAKHIHSIKPSKAVPMGSAPAAAWRLCSQEVADALAACLTRGTVEQGLHEDLLNADLCLIPKPGKQPDRPANLRPLDILRPDAKGLAGAKGRL